MQDIVDSIAGVGGVNGAAVFDPNGACVADNLSPPYELILVTEAFASLRAAVDFQSQLGGSNGENTAIVIAENGSLAVREIQGFYLVAFCGCEANMAMLGVAFNVARLKLERQVSAARFAPEVLEPTRSGSGPAFTTQAVTTRGTNPPRDNPPNGLPSHFQAGSTRQVRHFDGSNSYGRVAPPSNHDNRSPRGAPGLPAQGLTAPGGTFRGAGSMSASLRSEGDMSWNGGSRSLPVGAVGARVMRHLLETLMDHLGHEARPTLERELRRMGATPRTLDPAQFADLIRVAASYIEPPENRQRFVAEVLGDRKRKRS